MTTRLVVGGVLGLCAVLAPVAASAEPIPPACVVVDAEPVHLQAGYAPNGPSDCTSLPPATQ